MASNKRLALSRDQRSVLEAVYAVEKLPDAALLTEVGGEFAKLSAWALAEKLLPMMQHHTNVQAQKVAEAATLRREVQAVRAAGGLALSKLAGGRTGKGLSYSHSAVRGDWVGWFDGDEQGHWAEHSLSRYLQRVDTLMSQLAPLLAGAAGLGAAGACGRLPRFGSR